MDIVDVVQVKQYGGSLYLLVSTKLLKKVPLKEGDEFILALDNGNIVYLPKDAFPETALKETPS